MRRNHIALVKRIWYYVIHSLPRAWNKYFYFYLLLSHILSSEYTYVTRLCPYDHYRSFATAVLAGVNFPMGDLGSQIWFFFALCFCFSGELFVIIILNHCTIVVWNSLWIKLQNVSYICWLLNYELRKIPSFFLAWSNKLKILLLRRHVFHPSMYTIVLMAPSSYSVLNNLCNIRSIFV